MPGVLSKWLEIYLEVTGIFFYVKIFAMLGVVVWMIFRDWLDEFLKTRRRSKSRRA